ncbi:MAG: PIG-L family deacetylase [Planctomycetes bacterium]|nr:PIG-L family deacetylase [Planctomycetota bacterium]
MKKKILIVAAHPDDEVLGCGGTITRFADESEVNLLILGEGMTSRFLRRETGMKSKEMKKLKASIDKVLKIFKIEKSFILDFPDNQFDSVPLLNIVKAIEKVKNQIKPDIIYTHHRGDLNIDHRITYDAVLTACRPIKGETVKEIYSFEIPSSTEWNYPVQFAPNVFVDITSTIEKKIKGLKAYQTELKQFPHPRSEETIRVIGKRWGGMVGFNYAEVFEVVRVIR